MMQPFSQLYLSPTNLASLLEIKNSLDIGRKLNASKTHRRRPERLVNVLCTYNLRPVSRRYFNSSFVQVNSGYLVSTSRIGGG